jgi:uncharacterized membrane protein
MGAGIGVGIAHALGKNKLIIFTAAVTGLVGAFALNIIDGNFFSIFNVNGKDVSFIKFGTPGNPIGSYVATLFTIEIASLYQGKTKLDIILVPIGMLLLSFIAIYIAWPFIKLIDLFAELLVITINAGAAVKIIVGVLIAVIMGILLTMPTSSAAIWVAFASPIITGFTKGEIAFEVYDAMLLAGGAATVGCACHMVGFAVASYRENGFAGLIAQGLGTSMLQIPNIMKKPKIMLPMIISSAILGPISTCLFILKCSHNGGGMGTSGLVGVIDLFTNTTGALGVIGIILLMIILPAVLNFIISEFMRKKNWIKFGDMKLPD